MVDKDTPLYKFHKVTGRQSPSEEIARPYIFS